MIIIRSIITMQFHHRHLTVVAVKQKHCWDNKSGLVQGFFRLIFSKSFIHPRRQMLLFEYALYNDRKERRVWFLSPHNEVLALFIHILDSILCLFVGLFDWMNEYCWRIIVLSSSLFIVVVVGSGPPTCACITIINFGTKKRRKDRSWRGGGGVGEDDYYLNTPFK